MEHKSKIAITGQDLHLFSDRKANLRFDCNRRVLRRKSHDAAG